MTSFKNIQTTAVPLPIENVDTDQIIPARFLKATDKSGFGENLFRDWRYDEQDNPIQDFVLNNTVYQGEILIAGKNFGCGSSREHAAWALNDYGFKVVISSFFADIFKNNALINGILPITVEDDILHSLFSMVESDADTQFCINLEQQSFSQPKSGFNYQFEIDSFRKMCLLQGIDTVDYLVKQIPIIEHFEATHEIY